MRMWRLKNETTVQTMRNKGFTLLEILIAVSILAIALTAVFKAHSQSIAVTEEAKFNSIAPFLAQLRLAELENGISRDLTGGEGDFGDAYPGYRWQATVADVETTMHREDADRLKRIDVVVSLRNDTFQYRLRSYVLNNEG